MNREITVEYTPKFIKSILWILWINSIGISGFTALGIACLVFLPIIILSGYVFYLLGITLVGICLFLFLIKRSIPQMNNSVAKFNSVGVPTVKFNFTDNGLGVETNASCTEFFWQELKAVNKYPTVWLILFSGMSESLILPTNKLDRELKQFITYKLNKNRS